LPSTISTVGLPPSLLAIFVLRDGSLKADMVFKWTAFRDNGPLDQEVIEELALLPSIEHLAYASCFCLLDFLGISPLTHSLFYKFLSPNKKLILKVFGAKKEFCDVIKF